MSAINYGILITNPDHGNLIEQYVETIRKVDREAKINVFPTFKLFLKEDRHKKLAGRSFARTKSFLMDLAKSGQDWILMKPGKDILLGETLLREFRAFSLENRLNYCFFDGTDLSFYDFRIEYVSVKGIGELLRMDRQFLPDGSLNGFEISEALAYVITTEALRFYYEENFERYYKYPRAMQVEPASSCNLKCKMCYFGDGDQDFFQENDRFMKMDLFKRIIDEVSEYPFPPAVELCYKGEPLLNKNIVEMVRYASSKKVSHTLVTNATLLTEETSRALLDAGLGGLCVSIDGATKEVYEQIRVGADFEAVVGNFHKFLELNRLKKSPCHTCVRFVVQDLNRHEQDMIVAQWADKVDAIVMQFETTPTERARKIWNEDRFKKQESSVRLPKRRPCHVLWTATIINTNGEILPCTMGYHRKAEEIYGRLADKKTTILDVFNSAQARQGRTLSLENEYDKIPVCNQCDGVLCSEHTISRGMHTGDIFKKMTVGYDSYTHSPKMEAEARLFDFALLLKSIPVVGETAFRAGRKIYRAISS